MTLEQPTFRVFGTRESEEYHRILSEALSIKSSPSAIYPDLISSSYELTDEAAGKINQEHKSQIRRVINIDYIGMTATVLLDRDEKYTRKAHYHQLYELFSSLESLNASGIALKIRLLLQYPYSLAGQNRILSEIWTKRSFMGETTGRDETKLAPSLTEQHIETSALIAAQRYGLQNLQKLLDEFSPSGLNKIEIRFAFVSTLICGLRVNNLFFYDPYHYGRKRNDDTCALNSTPVVMIDGSNHCSAYEVFCNHFRCIWECDSTLDYDDVTCQDKGTVSVMIRKPENLRTFHKIDRLRSLPSQGIDWERRKEQLYQLANSLCPIVASVDVPERGFLAAAWETKDGRTIPCEPASMLADLFDRGFQSLPNPESVRVTVLQGQIGSSLASSLFGLMDSSTFSIIMLTREIEDKFCKPNVYVELGYLLHKNKRPKTFILAENGTSFPTDLQDIIFLPFERTRPHQSLKEMERVYEELLKAMQRARIINRDTLDLLIRFLKGY
jgi:hypothetical protein